MKLDVKSGVSLLKANLNEILCTIQGEGALVGTRQVFIRFSGCNLRCSYCDTSTTFNNEDCCNVYYEIGTTKKLEIVPNPFTVEQISNIINFYNSPWVSFTGGEPLLNAEFMGKLILNYQGKKQKFLLETNGTLPRELQKVINLFDCISMDIKLPSTVGRDYLKVHEEFLIIAKKKPCYIKMVITPGYIEDEITAVMEMVQKVNPDIPFFIQPVTPGKLEKGVDIFTCIALQGYCMNYLNDVRILPQVHPWLGLT